MSKDKYFVVDFGTYPFDVLFYFGKDDNNFKKVADEYGCETDDEIVFKIGSVDTHRGRCVIDGLHRGIVRLNFVPKTNKEYAMLQHEIYHCVVFMFEVMGIKWSLKSDEAFAYQIQYITEKVYDKL